MASNVIDVKKDRLRYTKNTFSSTITYLAILFNVLYFVRIYQSDVGNYYYTITIGISVLCNLLFLLIAFLCSEGLKNYKISYAYTVLVIGVFQLIRILGIPTDAHNTVITLAGEEIQVMTDDQFYYCVICLLISALACFIAGAVGIYKTVTLRNYMKQQGLE